MEYKIIEPLKYKEEIIELWNRNIGCHFPMDEKLFVQNIKNEEFYMKTIGAFENEELIGLIIYKIYELWENKNGHINSFLVDLPYRRKGIGKILLQKAEEDIKSHGIKNITAGGDLLQFFPGVPALFTGSIKFFEKQGYKKCEETYDLICDISKVDFSSLNMKITGEYPVKILEETEKEELFKFFKKSFPTRWNYETKKFFEMGMKNRDMLVVKDGDKVIGFCHIYDKEAELIGPSIYWRDLLGKNYGGLGPIGVDEEYRGKGLGLASLYRGLEELKKRKVEKMVIDWTELVDFYGMINFLPFIEYIPMIKEL